MLCGQGVKGGELTFWKIVYCEVRMKRGQSIGGIDFQLEFGTNKGSIDVRQESTALVMKKIEIS